MLSTSRELQLVILVVSLQPHVVAPTAIYADEHKELEDKSKRHYNEASAQHSAIRRLTFHDDDDDNNNNNNSDYYSRQQ